jgi:hypothetical protein
MTNYTRIKPLPAGVVYTVAQVVTATDSFDNNGACLLHIKNAGASPDSVVILAQRKCDTGTVHNVTVIVTNGTEKIIGPFDPGRFNDNTGRVQITHSYLTTVTAQVINYG